MNLASNELFISRRSPVLARGGIVASSQPLATAAGVEMLRQGGSAADAAVAAAAALAVTQPCSTGMGGDAFCLYYEAATRRVHALNGSGRSPASLDLDRATGAAAGGSLHLPPLHPYAVTVPGGPAAWADVVARFGRRPLAQVLAPAAEMAERGYPVAPQTARWWRLGAERQLAGRRHAGELLLEGRAPRAGEVMRIPTLARSLREVGEGGKAAFYGGRIAEAIVAAVAEEGGALSLADLAEHESEWVQPISLDYRGTRIWECPPNGHGLAVLVALNVARCLELAAAPAGSAARAHLLVECMRLAFAETAWHVADPAFYRAPVADLLSDGFGRDRARLVDPRRAMGKVARAALEGGRVGAAGDDTVYLCAVDAEGNACSFINSTFTGFGTGIVAGGCGLSLQNRGCGFRLDPKHPNRLEPRKRPYHTIIPGMATRESDGALVAPFGVMGGMMQPQGHLQVVSALVDDGLDPQAALDRPRFQIQDGEPDGVVMIEDAPGGPLARGLAALGHRVAEVQGADRYVFGLGQVILAEAAGAGPAVCWAGSDPRGDGCALGRW